MTTFLLVIPGSDIPKANFLDEIYFDKWVHIGLFGGLTFLTAYPFVSNQVASKKLLIKICTSFIIYGVLMEFVQKFWASERTFDGWDMVADGTGCFVGFLLSNSWRLRLINRKD
jgi:VanZ family protein